MWRFFFFFFFLQWNNSALIKFIPLRGIIQVYFLLEWWTISEGGLVTHTCVSRKHLFSRAISFKTFFPKNVWKRNNKIFSCDLLSKMFYCGICIEIQFRRRGLLSICLMWFTANCNSNLFVWICGCEKDQMLDSEARWRKSEGLCLCGGSRMNRMLIN